MAAKATPKRKPAKRRPVVDRKARELIARILEILEELIDRDQASVEDRERLWNSLMSAWVDIEILKDDGKLAKEARKLERELNIR